jgi:hypothetical protein
MIGVMLLLRLVCLPLLVSDDVDEFCFVNV